MEWRKSFRKLGIYMHYDNDGCVEIIAKKNKRLMLFWPPGFAYISKSWLINWNVMRKLWFDVWDRRKEKMN